MTIKFVFFDDDPTGGIELDYEAMYGDEAELETKARRYVRTPAGARRFGQPIGSLIVEDVPAPKLPPGGKFYPKHWWGFRDAVKRGASLDELIKLAGGNEQDLLDALTHMHQDGVLTDADLGISPDLPPIGETAKAKAAVKSVAELVDEGWDPEAAVKEHKRLVHNEAVRLIRARQKAEKAAKADAKQSVPDKKPIGVHPEVFADLALSKGDQPKALYDAKVGGALGPGAVSAAPGQWARALVEDTDAAPSELSVDKFHVPVVGLTVGAKKVERGIAVRYDGVSYLIETEHAGELTPQERARLLAAIQTTQAMLKTVPESRRSLMSGVALLRGPNPDDDYWTQKYGTPIVSEATGGFGVIHLWNSQNSLRPNPGTLAHEFGHTLDIEVAHETGDDWFSDQAPWKNDAAASVLTAIRLDSLGFVETRPGAHKIDFDASTAMTSYADSHEHEDFAESVRLYLKDRREGKLGYLKDMRQDGQLVPQAGVLTDRMNVRFADLWPQKARHLDKIFGVESEPTKLRDVEQARLLEELKTRHLAHLKGTIMPPPAVVAYEIGLGHGFFSAAEIELLNNIAAVGAQDALDEEIAQAKEALKASVISGLEDVVADRVDAWLSDAAHPTRLYLSDVQLADEVASALVTFADHDEDFNQLDPNERDAVFRSVRKDAIKMALATRDSMREARINDLSGKWYEKVRDLWEKAGSPLDLEEPNLPEPTEAQRAKLDALALNESRWYLNQVTKAVLIAGASDDQPPLAIVDTHGNVIAPDPTLATYELVEDIDWYYSADVEDAQLTAFELLEMALVSKAINASIYGPDQKLFASELEERRTKRRVNDRLAALIKKFADEQELAQSATEAAQAAQEMLTDADLEKDTKKKLLKKKAAVKFYAKKGGATPEEAQKAADEYYAAAVAEALEHQGVDLSKVQIVTSTPGGGDNLIPGHVKAKRAESAKWLKQAGTYVHPNSRKGRSGGHSFYQDGQAKDNIVGELSQRLDNPEDWEILRTYKEKIAQLDKGKGWGGPIPRVLKPYDETTEDERYEILYEEVNQRIATWASTAGDSNPWALAMQHAIKDEFGLKADWGQRFLVQGVGHNQAKEDLLKQVTTNYAVLGPFFRRFARVMHDHTQEELTKAGFTQIGLWRGMSTHGAAWGLVGQKVRPPLQPANSWATSKAQARKFVGYSDARLLKATVPISRILGTARTGFGCLDETEFVVLDSDGLVEIEQGHTSKW